MLYTNKLAADSPFPAISLPDLQGQQHVLGKTK